MGVHLDLKVTVGFFFIGILFESLFEIQIKC